MLLTKTCDVNDDQSKALFTSIAINKRGKLHFSQEGYRRLVGDCDIAVPPSDYYVHLVQLGLWRHDR